MAESESEFGSSYDAYDSLHRTRQSSNLPCPPSATQRTEWLASGRTSSVDSGISELLTSSPGGSPSPIMPHSPSRHSRPNTGDMNKHHNRKTSASRRSHHSIGHPGNIAEKHPRSPVQTGNSRPNSAFTNCSPLPHIGQQVVDPPVNMTHNSLSKTSEYSMLEASHPKNRTVSPKQPHILPDTNQPSPPSSTNTRPHSGKKISTRELRRQQFARRKNSQQDTTTPTSATTCEPSENEPRILLAIKLPSGERLQRYFHPSECFANICTYAELESKQTLSNCNLYINQVPKILIKSWKQTFQEANLQDRTLLCLEEKDD